MRTIRRWPVVSGWAVLGLLVAGSVASQPMSLATPDDSPLWWPLSDESTPAELRAAWRDPESSRLRYRAAVQAGLAREIGAEELGRLRFYLHPKQTPHLVAMWHPFWAFAWACHQEHQAEALARELARFGVSPEGRRILIETGASNEASIQEFVTAIQPKFQEYWRLVDELRNRHAGDPAVRSRIEHALSEGDAKTLAALSGRRESEVIELSAAGTSQRAMDITAESLGTLRLRASSGDWRGFRRYLREVIVPQQSAFVEFNP